MTAKEFLIATSTIKLLQNFVENHSAEEITTIISNIMGISKTTLASNPMGGYCRVKNSDGTFSKGSGVYAVVLQDVKQNIHEYVKVYESLMDDISCKIFMNQMLFRLLPSMDFIKMSYELSNKYPQYFDLDIIKFSNNEVFADCGGFTGDTAEEFIKQCSKYKRVYIYEPLASNISKCEENLKNFENIIIRQAGVGLETSSYGFSGGGSSGSFASFDNEQESESFDVVSLDDDIKEDITFIKMDVECFEPMAIQGAMGHLQKKNPPKLAICLYHMVSDLWEIPKLIHSINSEYKFYLRHYDNRQNWEYVLYGV